MSNKWKDSPELWKGIYDSNTTSRIGDLGFGTFERTIVEVRREIPEELKGISSLVEGFWNEFSASRPAGSKPTNDPKYGITGMNDVSIDGKNLILNVFECGYADIRFKNSRDKRYDEKLTPKQREFLNNLLVLGVVGYVQSDSRYLFGVRSDAGPRGGLVETVPQGLVDLLKDKSEDIFYSALARELKEETCLDMAEDISDKTITHLQVGPKFGDFAVISRLRLKSGREEKVRESREHTKLYFGKLSTDDFKDDKKYAFNPVTVALFEKL